VKGMKSQFPSSKEWWSGYLMRWKKTCIDDPRWWLECRSRPRELCKSKILLRCWSHTWREKKNQEESGFWHPEPPSPYKASPCHVTPRKQKGSHTTRLQLQTSWETSRRPTGELCSISAATPGINQYSPLDRLTPHLDKKTNWIINKDLKRNMQQRGQGAL
jgi:hypothetical protein